VIAALAGTGAVLVVAAMLVRAGDGAAIPRFSRDVQPIFDRNCIACHPVSYPYLDLRRGRPYRELYRVSAATRPAFERVVPGRPELSYLLVHPPDPSTSELLTPADRQVIAAWIRAGARDD